MSNSLGFVMSPTALLSVSSVSDALAMTRANTFQSIKPSSVTVATSSASSVFEITIADCQTTSIADAEFITCSFAPSPPPPVSAPYGGAVCVHQEGGALIFASLAFIHCSVASSSGLRGAVLIKSKHSRITVSGVSDSINQSELTSLAKDGSSLFYQSLSSDPNTCGLARNFPCCRQRETNSSGE